MLRWNIKRRTGVDKRSATRIAVEMILASPGWGWTKGGLARKYGCTRSGMNQILATKSTPYACTIERLAKALEVSPSLLLRLIDSVVTVQIEAIETAMELGGDGEM